MRPRASGSDPFHCARMLNPAVTQAKCASNPAPAGCRCAWKPFYPQHCEHHCLSPHSTTLQQSSGVKSVMFTASGSLSSCGVGATRRMPWAFSKSSYRCAGGLLNIIGFLDAGPQGRFAPGLPPSSYRRPYLLAANAPRRTTSHKVGTRGPETRPAKRPGLCYGAATATARGL